MSKTLLRLIILIMLPLSAQADNRDWKRLCTLGEPKVLSMDTVTVQANETDTTQAAASRRQKRRVTSTLKKLKFTYSTTDEHGDAITLSALAQWPTDETLTNVVLMCPYTHCSDAECATQSEDLGNGMAEKTQTGNYLLVITDGEGFGWTKDRTQLYLNHEVWAKQEVDCLAAAMHLAQHTYELPFSDNWTTVIAGTSQGGGTALATLRYMETTTDPITGQTFDELYNVDFANICCGPYNPVTTVKVYFQEWYRLTYPCVIPMVIKSMMLSYPDIMAGIKDYPRYSVIINTMVTFRESNKSNLFLSII